MDFFLEDSLGAEVFGVAEIGAFLADGFEVIGFIVVGHDSQGGVALRGVVLHLNVWGGYLGSLELGLEILIKLLRGLLVGLLLWRRVDLMMNLLRGFVDLLMNLMELLSLIELRLEGLLISLIEWLVLDKGLRISLKGRWDVYWSFIGAVESDELAGVHSWLIGVESCLNRSLLILNIGGLR